MTLKKLSLKLLPERMAVCRFGPEAPLPDWIDGPGFYSVTRTAAELTIVCSEALTGSDTLCECGWRCFKILETLDFSEIGIIFSLTRPLAENGISIFVLSTFDTDYFMIKESDLAGAIDALTGAGHRIKE